jgi:hypothetical protein
MLRSLKGLVGYKIGAQDGEIGKVVDFFFEENDWRIRYLVAETGSWLFGKKVLISPSAFEGTPDWKSQIFPVNITKEKVKTSPERDKHMPVSREKEIEIMKYFNWPVYWDYGIGMETGSGIPPIVINELQERIRKGQFNRRENDIRSSREIIGYKVETKDGNCGHVVDLIINDTTWSIRYLVVDVNDWLPGGKVLVAITWADSISWSESKVTVSMLTKENVKGCPEYDPSKPVNREYEERLYDYYGRPKYWD